MTCEHASTRLVAGQMRVDGSKLQRCRLCGMYRRRYRDGGFGPWHDRDNGMPEPQRREPPPSPSPLGSAAHVKETMAALDLVLADVPGDQLVAVLREGMAAVDSDSDRAAARRPSPRERVFSAEIIALARQLSEKRLEVDLLAMRLADLHVFRVSSWVGGSTVALPETTLISAVTVEESSTTWCRVTTDAVHRGGGCARKSLISYA